MIDKFSFGKLKIKHETYEDSDIIIFWDGEIIEKEKTHNLTERELEDIILKEPEVIVIGTGSSGMVKIDPEVEKTIKNEQIDLIKEPTEKAVEIFNNLLKQKKRVAGYFHLTC